MKHESFPLKSLNRDSLNPLIGDLAQGIWAVTQVLEYVYLENENLLGTGNLSKTRVCLLLMRNHRISSS